MLKLSLILSIVSVYLVHSKKLRLHKISLRQTRLILWWLLSYLHSNLHVHNTHLNMKMNTDEYADNNVSLYLNELLLFGNKEMWIIVYLSQTRLKVHRSKFDDRCNARNCSIKIKIWWYILWSGRNGRRWHSKDYFNGFIMRDLIDFGPGANLDRP